MELKDLTQESENPELWNDRKKAETLLRQLNNLRDNISEYDYLKDHLAEYIEFIKMAESENDDDLLADMEANIAQLQVEAAQKEIEVLFSGDNDASNCFLDINAGAGGTESYDWAEMLLRMYLRWADRHNFKATIIHTVSGDEAGIKSATIKINGKNAYGWCRTESGVHRLVRTSPFNSANKRMTSFASAWFYPEINNDIDVQIDAKDLRIDTYRASGAGGQHVNTTDSAVRITHIPTSIVVQCQNDRSQHKNKAACMSMLASKLYNYEIQKKEEKIQNDRSAKTDIGWGHQIRSYVLHPYQMVKDLRTSFETSDTSKVLDGDLDNFIFHALSHDIK